MQDIDFLPVEYRQRRTRRRQEKYRNVAVGLAGLLAVAAAFYQHFVRRHLAEELAELTPKYEQAIRQTEQLGRLTSELAMARIDADLFTYLRHPWPRTQILSALLTALPDEVGFTRLAIRRQAQTVRPHRESDPLAELSLQSDPLAPQAPAVVDLASLRRQFDDAQTIVLVEGITTESSALHQYLSALNRSGLFVRAELDSLEADRLGEQAILRFQATAVVCPGYGMPGGPAGSPAETVAALQQ